MYKWTVALKMLSFFPLELSFQDIVFNLQRQTTTEKEYLLCIYVISLVLYLTDLKIIYKKKFTFSHIKDGLAGSRMAWDLWLYLWEMRWQILTYARRGIFSTTTEQHQQHLKSEVMSDTLYWWLKTAVMQRWLH